MKVLLYGRFGTYPNEIEETVKASGLEIVDKNPEVVICYGGDGTLLGAERDYPGVPKLPLKNSDTSHNYSHLTPQELLGLLSKNQLKTDTYSKIQATFGNNKIVALNDIVIAHKYPNMAIRFDYLSTEFIGDGVVIASPFGSTGYFYSITRKSFKDGLGIAPNNIHNKEVPAKILNDDEVIKIKITRGPAVITNDNNPIIIDLQENQEITISKAKEEAKILTL